MSQTTPHTLAHTFTSHFVDFYGLKRGSDLRFVTNRESAPIDRGATAVRTFGFQADGRPFGNQRRLDGVAADQVVRYSTSARRMVSPRLTPSSSARVSTNVTRSSGRRTE